VFLGEGASNTINVIPASKLSSTIHEKITLAIIIVWSSKFPARKKLYTTQANFFQAYSYRAHRAVIIAIAQLSCSLSATRE